jgi:two-component system sensor histidine kinase ChvG
MALDTDRIAAGTVADSAAASRPPAPGSLAPHARATNSRVPDSRATDSLAPGQAAGRDGHARLRSWFARQPLVRFVSANLLRRILLSNLVGLLLLLIGILYLTQYHTWLIGAKQDALKTQGEIIAAAIAANAKVTRQEIDLDPSKLPEAEGSLIPFRDDGFAALELSIRPEQVTPILRRLTQNTRVRARIYGRDVVPARRQ